MIQKPISSWYLSHTSQFRLCTLKHANAMSIHIFIFICLPIFDCFHSRKIVELQIPLKGGQSQIMPKARVASDNWGSKGACPCPPENVCPFTLTEHYLNQ